MLTPGEKNSVVKPEELPVKDSTDDACNSSLPGDELPREVDDKLIGDDRDLQDALDEQDAKKQQAARDNNY
jgi:hypothetical protein